MGLSVSVFAPGWGGGGRADETRMSRQDKLMAPVRVDCCLLFTAHGFERGMDGADGAPGWRGGGRLLLMLGRGGKVASFINSIRVGFSDWAGGGAVASYTAGCSRRGDGDGQAASGLVASPPAFASTSH
ncbi:hypothetical protein CDD83_6053 [Cordyceps sp. RAO-2017]|nr:hypothetical protein CDD83_6053 [Cordyceps sp. RAO-2017]